MQTTATISGPYDLARQRQFFGGWLSPHGADARTIVMAFPVEGWRHSAAVLLRQSGPQTIEGEVSCPEAPQAWRQALAVLSADADGSGWPAVGERDPEIGALQRANHYLRPVLFHSPYEAACAFVIGHRIRIAQGRAIRARIARAHGEAFTVGGATVHAFPAPQVLRALDELPGVDAEKVARLHGIADAALDGRLDRARLLDMPYADAVADVQRLRGIGDFFAAGIVLRGAGTLDAPHGETREAWRPYRTWCAVLLRATSGETTRSR